jgi:homeobox-leucine zipper protein
LFCVAECNYDVQNQYATVFSSIVSRAATLEVLSTGVAGNYNGALQVVRILTM